MGFGKQEKKRILSVGKFVFVLRFKGKTATMLATINEKCCVFNV